MMDWTDRHCRFFHRLLTRRALLYTEMVTARGGAARRSRRACSASAPRSTPSRCSSAAPTRQARRGGGDRRGLRLRRDQPQRRLPVGPRAGGPLRRLPDGGARRSWRAASRPCRRACAVPVTVKCRIGIDDQDSEADLERFVDAVAGAGCRTFIVHARKAWLQGLSPKENREVPPLDYARVYRLKAAHPDLEIVHQRRHRLARGGGGRTSRTSTAWRSAAPPTRTPICWPRSTGGCSAQRAPAPSRSAVLEALIPYAERHLRAGGRLNNIDPPHPRPLPRPAAGPRLPPPPVRARPPQTGRTSMCCWRPSASPKARARLPWRRRSKRSRNGVRPSARDPSLSTYRT